MRPQRSSRACRSQGRQSHRRAHATAATATTAAIRCRVHLPPPRCRRVRSPTGSGRSSPAQCSSRCPPRRRRSREGRRRGGRCRTTRSAGRCPGGLQDGSHYEARLRRAPGKSLGFPTAIDQDEAVLIGRKTERAALQALVDGAVGGTGGALLLTGEPGMGKTMLLDEAVERVGSSLTVLRASGRESDADLPFAVLGELLRPAEAEIDELPGPQASALRGALGLEEVEGLVDGLAVGVATLGLLATLALRRPVLAIVDDLQWVDEPSRASISFVARRLSQLHIALLCAGRDGELDETVSEIPRLELHGLRARDAGELLAGAARVPLDRAVRRRLLELSRGKSARPRRAADGTLGRTASGDRRARRADPVNGGIERTFGARVARLPERTRRALLLASAAGSDAGASLASALDKAELELGDLEPAELDGLVALEDGDVTFRHPLVSSVVYQGETEESRRALTRFSPTSIRTPIAEPGIAPRRRWPLTRPLRRARRGRGPCARARRAGLCRPRIRGRGAVLGERRGARDSDWRARRAQHTEPVMSRRGSSRGCSRRARLRSDHARRPAARGVRPPHARRRSRRRPPRAHGSSGAARRDRPAPRGDDAPPRVEAPHLPARSAGGGRRGRARPRAASVRRARPRPSRGAEHEPDGGRPSRRSRGGPCGRGCSGGEAPHGHAHTLGIAWPLVWLEDYDLARDVTDRAIALQREAGFLLYLPQSLLAAGRAGLPDRQLGRRDLGGEGGARPVRGDPAAGRGGRRLRGCWPAWWRRAVTRKVARALAQRAFASDVEFGLRSAVGPRARSSRLSRAR